MTAREQALAILAAPIRFHEGFRAQVADTLSLRRIGLRDALALAQAYQIAMRAAERQRARAEGAP